MTFESPLVWVATRGAREQRKPSSVGHILVNFVYIHRVDALEATLDRIEVADTRGAKSFGHDSAQAPP